MKVIGHMRTLCRDLVASRKVVLERKTSNCAVEYILVSDALEFHKHSEADALSKGVIGVPLFYNLLFYFWAFPDQENQYKGWLVHSFGIIGFPFQRTSTERRNEVACPNTAHT